MENLKKKKQSFCEASKRAILIPLPSRGGVKQKSGRRVRTRFKETRVPAARMGYARRARRHMRKAGFKFHRQSKEVWTTNIAYRHGDEEIEKLAVVSYRAIPPFRMRGREKIKKNKRSDEGNTAAEMSKI